MNEKQKRICIGTVFAVMIAIFGELISAGESGQGFSLSSTMLLVGVILILAVLNFWVVRDPSKRNKDSN
jgi:hypothetical protein